MSDESRKAEMLRAAGFNARTGDGGITYFLDGNGVCWSTNEALVIAAADRAREDRALLATLASGFAAQGRHPVECVVYARETFMNLYGYTPEIGTLPAADDAAKVARVEALVAGEMDERTMPVAWIRAALAGKVMP